MRVALINPPWSFDGSIYFGCREPHLPLELALLGAAAVRGGPRTADFRLSYLGLVAARPAGGSRPLPAGHDRRHHRADLPVLALCAPELRVPLAALRALREALGLYAAVGPHGSATPRSVLRNLAADVVVMGECEETLVRLAGGERDRLPGIAYRDGDGIRVNGGPQAARFTDAPPLSWPERWIACHRYHHHRFDLPPTGPGGEVEASRGCPYHCTFCAKENFRTSTAGACRLCCWRRSTACWRKASSTSTSSTRSSCPIAHCRRRSPNGGSASASRPASTCGKPEMLELLGRAGCVSIEAGVESVTAEGRDLLDKAAEVTTEELTERLIEAKLQVPSVQGNLIACRRTNRRRSISRRAPVRTGRVGERAGAALSLSRFAGLPPAVGRGG